MLGLRGKSCNLLGGYGRAHPEVGIGWGHQILEGGYVALRGEGTSYVRLRSRRFTGVHMDSDAMPTTLLNHVRRLHTRVYLAKA